MPLYRIVYGLSKRSVKPNLNNQLYQLVIFNRKYSVDDFSDSKGWFFHPKEEKFSTKSINLAFNSLMAQTQQYERTVFSELLEELNLHHVLGNELLSHGGMALIEVILKHSNYEAFIFFTASPQLLSPIVESPSCIAVHPFLKWKYFFSKDISQFRHFGIELDREELTRNVVEHLGPFPFDMTPIYYYSKCKRLRISVKTILTIIEAQYLAYRLKIELRVIHTYFKEMRNCFFYYKSMRSLKRNIDALLGDKNLKNMSIFNIIFFLNNLRPFCVKQLRQVEKNLLGVSWERTPFVCPSLVKHSYQGIMFRIKMLRDMGFTDEQIRLGLPYIGVQVSNLYQNISYMLSEFGSYKNDEFFLRLLGACYSQKRGLNGMIWKSYEAMQKAVLLKEEKRLSLLKSYRMICFLQEKLGMTKKEWKIVRDHPAVIVEGRVIESLNLLEQKGFTKEEIRESISIILYPKNLIEKNLKKVAEETDNLRKFGFEDGCVRKTTNYFSRGTKLKRKTLQLCLYYVDKSVYLMEDVVLDLDKVGEEIAKQPDEVQVDK